MRFSTEQWAAGLMAAAAVVVGVASGVPHSTSVVDRGFASGSHVNATSTNGADSNLRDKHGKIVSSAKIYAIYWGKPTEFPADFKTAMPVLLGGLNRTAYLATIDEYMRGGTASTTYVRSFDDPSRAPSVDPTPQVILAEVSKVLRRAHVQPDPNGVYLVFSSNMPNVDYCAWHAAGSVQGVQTQIAYVPNSAGSSTCYPTDSYANVTPYTFGTRSMGDNAVHELLEAMTDPVPGTSWVDGQSNEIGDKCDFVYSAPVVLSGSNNVWQLQSQWSNAAKSCVQQATVSGARTVKPPQKRGKS